MTTLEKIYKELAERFKDEPNKNIILGYTMGVLEKNKAALVEEQVKNLRKAVVSGSVAVEDALAFAEYFRNNFDYYDCNANGRVYKWIDLQKRGQSAMTMQQIFDYWQSRSN